MKCDDYSAKADDSSPINVTPKRRLLGNKARRPGGDCLVGPSLLKSPKAAATMTRQENVNMVEDKLDAVKSRRAAILGHYRRKRLSNSAGK